MTPKEKAKDIEYNIAKIYRDNRQIISSDVLKDVAKYMVNEILKLELHDGYDKDYWEQVKQEIERL